MNRTINQLPEKTSLEPNDELILFDNNDGVSKKIKGSNIKIPFQYSAEEQFTGKYWVDGKPIYSRTFYSATNWANNAVIGTIENFDFLVDIRNIGRGTSAYFCAYDPQTVASIVASDGRVIVTRVSVFANNAPSAVIIEYTKTTD